MKIITIEDRIKSVAQRYKNQYQYTWDSCIFGRKNHQLHYDLLLKAKTKEDVANALQRFGWVELRCDECRKEINTVIQMGEEPDYESSTALLCIDCLKEAIKHIEEK